MRAATLERLWRTPTGPWAPRSRRLRTMMNKGLEVIEAAHLFAMPEERIEVLVHPQSIVHSLVAYADGSALAQLGQPDMRTPIAYALAWPDRLRARRPAGPADRSAG